MANTWVLQPTDAFRWRNGLSHALYLFIVYLHLSFHLSLTPTPTPKKLNLFSFLLQDKILFLMQSFASSLSIVGTSTLFLFPLPPYIFPLLKRPGKP